MDSVSLAFLSAGAALVYGVVLMRYVLSKPAGDDKMQAISRAIREGAAAYLKRQNTVVAGVGIIVASALYFWLGKNIALGFVVGAAASALAGYLGMFVAVRANVRVAEAA
ncbi:MAG: sodium/proton-translocating pyrophosphatase, partial [Patescibacteria group bacterium]